MSRYSQETCRELAKLDPEKINYDLMTALISWICSNGKPGAVLIFMPGLMEITKLHDALQASAQVLRPRITLHPPPTGLTSSLRQRKRGERERQRQRDRETDRDLEPGLDAAAKPPWLCY